MDGARFSLWKRWRLHTGVDFPNPLGTPVLSVATGQVVYVGDDSARRFGLELNYYGKLVIIKLTREYCQFAIPAWEHDGCDVLPVFVLYAHLNQIFVKAGQSVLTGDLIGTVGMTGIAIGPHLHLEVRLGQEDAISATRNPALWMRPLEGYGIIAGQLLDAEGRPVRDDRLLIYRVDEDTQLWRVVRTYPEDSLINSDDAWNENFVLPEVPAGEYFLVAGRGAGIVRRTVTVTSGRMSFAEVALSQETRTEVQREASSAEVRRAP